MKRMVHRVRTLVKREGAPRYLMLTLISFALAVIITRMFLQATGYPNLGEGEIHIAHVLLGGLLLFVATLLPLIYANRSILVLTSILSGTGVGLFIDEVGKFLTQENDYFYPPALPIIYTFFLVTVLIYVQVRKKPHDNPRAELYRSLDSLAEVLDYDLDPNELSELKWRLKNVTVKKNLWPALASLSESLLKFLNSRHLDIVPESPNFFEKFDKKFVTFESKFIKRDLYKATITVWLTLSGSLAIIDLFTSYSAFFSPEALLALVSRLVESGIMVSDISIYWFLVRLTLEAIVGVGLILAAFLIAKGTEKMGLSIAYYAILLSLTTVNLLVFYFDQTRAIFLVLGQLTLFLLIIHFRHRFLQTGT